MAEPSHNHAATPTTAVDQQSQPLLQHQTVQNQDQQDSAAAALDTLIFNLRLVRNLSIAINVILVLVLASFFVMYAFANL